MAKGEIAIVYMVAGLSSRFGGKIKQFARVGPKGETLIEVSLNQALKAGFTKIAFIVGEKTEKPFKEMFGDNYKGIPIIYTLQKYDSQKRDKPWGTSDAVCTLNEVINCPFVVCNGDDIYGEKTFRILADSITNTNKSATIGYKLGDVLPDKGEVNRAIFELDSNGTVKSIQELFRVSKLNLAEKGLTEDSLCSMNIYALQPELLKQLNNLLVNFKKENEGNRIVEVLIQNELAKLITRGALRLEIYPSPERWFGVTSPEDEETVKKQLLKA